MYLLVAMACKLRLISEQNKKDLPTNHGDFGIIKNIQQHTMNLNKTRDWCMTWQWDILFN